MKKLLTIILFGFIYMPCEVRAQKIYIAAQYEFMGEPDQFGFSTLLRLYLEKYNYEAEIVPQSDQNTVLRKLTPIDYAVQVQRKSNMFMTRITIKLVNANGEVIATSPEGNSREKEFRYANIESLRMAMDHFTALKNHTFLDQAKTESTIDKSEKQEVMVADGIANDRPIVAETNDYLEARSLSDVSVGLYSKNKTTPDLVLYKTSSRDCFMVIIDGKSNGVLLYQNQKWYWEYYKDNQLISKEQQIKGL
jgi:hypothetical protein